MKSTDAGMETDARRDKLERLYDAHFETILGYLCRRTDRATAHDLATDTLVVAWQRLDHLPNHEAGWLCGIARNLLANHNRASQRRRALAEHVADNSVLEAPSAEEQVFGSDSEVLAALRMLSPADQEVLMLTAWDGLSGAEAAEALGCTRVTYNVRLFRARRRLARLLEFHQPVDRAAMAAGGGKQ